MENNKTPAQAATEFENRYIGANAFEDLLRVLGTMRSSSFLLALESDKREVGADLENLEFRLTRLQRWEKKLERWLRIISYHKRQCAYDLARSNGYGGITVAAKAMGVTRQRAHMMHQEAEAERLMEFNPKELI